MPLSPHEDMMHETSSQHKKLNLKQSCHSGLIEKLNVTERNTVLVQTLIIKYVTHKDGIAILISGKLTTSEKKS